MPGLPAGTITFLFTDIEGSTRLLDELGDRYADVLADHHRLIRAALVERQGQEVDTQGDAFFVAFSRATDAVLAAVAAQRGILGHAWPENAAVRVRMGLHTGEALSAETGYVGMNVHRAARISSVAHGGQILASEATQALVREDLHSDISLADLGLHRLKDLARPQRIFQVVAPGLPGDFPPLRSLDVLPNNLPLQLTSFVGRQREIDNIKEALGTARLVTLTGTGGAGKTRLALQVGAEILPEFPDGVWFVELASLVDETLLPQTIAAAVGAREEAGRSITETVLEFLRRKRLLLIVDNCEHMVGACADLAHRLLRGCADLRLLATSREGLGVAGELTYPVPSLSLPDGHRLPPPEDLLRSESVRLFYERAILSRPGFRITPDNAPAVAQIARRLDGIPLAIELAAVRVRALSVEQIAERLDDRFRLLSGGARTVLPRHRTLQAALDWSHNLLSEQERLLLRRVGVFVGGFALEAAEAICAGDGVEEADVINLLSHLVEKSLVIFDEQDGQGRYRLLETVRQYALDRLLESEESDRMRVRHRDFFLAWAEEQREHIEESPGPDVELSFGQIEAEHDNLRTALQWSWERGEALLTLQLAAALGPFWSRRAYWGEGRQWLELCLPAADAPKTLRAPALYFAGTLAWYQGDNERTAARLEESLALYRELGTASGVAATLDFLAIVAYRGGDYRRAATLLEESLTLLRATGDRPEMGFALYLLGIVARLRGDYDRAEAFGHESLAISRELGLGRREPLTLDSLGLVARNRGDLDQALELCVKALSIFRARKDKFGIAASLNSLALIATDRGDLARARSLCAECLSLSREVGEKGAIARALNVLGRIAHLEGDDAQALAHHREGLTLFRELGEPLGIAQSLERLAIVAESSTQPERAGTLFAAAAALRERIGSHLPPIDRKGYEPVTARIRSTMGEDVFEAAWAKGRAMSQEQAVTHGLGEPR